MLYNTGYLGPGTDFSGKGVHDPLPTAMVSSALSATFERAIR